MSPAEKEARQEQADRKMREAAEKAYNKSLRFTEEAPEEDAGAKNKTKARKTAEFMESKRMNPASTLEAQTSEGSRGPRMMRGPAEVYDAVRSVVSPRKPRSEEEMSELTREVGRGMKKGGFVKAADGCCQRGKTKGRMV